MKSIDFSKPGGFPLTQDQLGYLQAAYKETVTALAKVGGGIGPFIISGMAVDNPVTGTYNATEGWFFYNGEMIHAPAMSITGVSAGNDVYVLLAESNDTLIYNSGSTHEVILDNHATLTALPTGTAEDATRFLLSSLKPFGVGFGIANRQAVWNTLVVNTDPSVGGVTGTVYYKKDYTANTLHIRGLLTANNAQNFAASPTALYSLMGTLPVNYMPASNVYFTSYYFVSSLIKDDLGVAWVKQVNCALNTSGQFYVNWLRPEIAFGGYGINFNTIIPLD
ncbi:MAG: hypothetical protein V4649_04510 [Bacteroidota bacterium]